MRRLFSWIGAGIVACAFMTAPVIAQDKPKAKPEDQFKKLDKNADGKLTVEEFTGKRTGDAAEKAKQKFAKLDKNSDKNVDLEEFKARGKKAK